jgi:signal transduction histidine kinase
VRSPLADLAEIRRALLDHALDDGLQAAAQLLANACAPAHVEVWLADQTPSTGELSRAGGLELVPTLRLRAAAGSGHSLSTAQSASESGIASSAQLASRHPDPIVEDIAAIRRPLVLAEVAHNTLAHAWLAAASPAIPWLGALAAYPLQVRGQFLGALVLGSTRSLGPEHLAVLEATADLCALATEHDCLLSYSRSQEALAQTVVHQAPVAVAVLAGPDHVFTLVNPAFAQLLGVEQSVRGRRLEDVVAGADQLRESLRLDAVYLTGEPQAMIELPIHLGRGLTYWNVTSAPLPRRIDRHVGGVLVAAVDVTYQVLERQRALEAAAVAEERLSQMMALHATSLAVSSQLGADPRELLADILRRSITLLEARAGAVYVRDRRTDELEAIVCHGLRGDYVGRRIRGGEGLASQVAHTGQGLRVDDIRLYSASPAIYAGEAISAVVAAPLICHGRAVGVLEVLDDADRRTFTRDDLRLLELFAAPAAQAIENARTYVALERAYQAQRELDRFKDDFIATASHELRTPLTGVQGFLDLLLEYPGSRDEPLALEFLQKAAESAAEMAELTERLLETSRLDTGSVELRREPVHLRTLVDELLHAQADTAAIRPAHTLVADVPVAMWVWADPDRLREVLGNLVGNAIKYSPRGGTVRVAGATEAAGPTAGYAITTVSDQGIGIAPSERHRLFERFSRLDAARSSQIRGTGLGLYICRQLIQAMGGSIWLQESALGRGSTFAVALPLVAPTDHVDPSAA